MCKLVDLAAAGLSREQRGRMAELRMCLTELCLCLQSGPGVEPSMCEACAPC